MGIDTHGSVFKKFKETGVFDKHQIYPYITEGIGEDFLPKNVDFDIVDHFEKVTDKVAAIMTRRIAREEGIFAGNSAGSAMAGLLQPSSSHIYALPGVYTVVVTVTDDDGGIATSIFQFVVIFDPNDGFVTGGGWINSPAGAYAANPLTGKANFGFVAKYQKGATVPTGQTEFQFQVGNLNFHSTVYEWLVIAGAKAQYKGSGTINGAGNYGFLLTATDGGISGGGAVDKFRIKIWNKIGGAVVYDNVLGGSDDIDTANPLAIAGGSIVIHK